MSEILPQLESRFGDWAAPSTPRGTKAIGDVPAPQPRIILIDRPQSPQSLILGGQVLDVRGTDDRLVLDAAMEVLGNGFSSRINTDLRETRGWSYGSRSFVSALEGRSPYVINAPVQADRTGEAIASIIAVHQGFLGDEGVNERELGLVMDAATRRLAGQFETSSAVLGALRSNVLFQRPDDYWEQAGTRYLGLIERLGRQAEIARTGLTAQSLDQAARGAIDPSRFVWVVVGDASVVRPQLEALGLPVEVRPAQ